MQLVTGVTNNFYVAKLQDT